MRDELYFTQRGLAKLCEEIEDLKNKIKDLKSQIAHAAEVGGDNWHDNFAYESLTSEIRGMERYLFDKEQTLKSAVLVEQPESFDKVTIGACVKIIHNGKEMIWEIVGFGESDPPNHMIAYNAPLASLFMEKRKGEVITGIIGRQRNEIEIIEIMKGEENVHNT